MSKLVFHDVPGWRVLVDSVVDYIFDREIPALNRAAEILAGNPGALVTVVGPTGVSFTVAGEQPEPPAEPEDPEQPEDPENPEIPEEPEQPDEPTEPEPEEPEEPEEPVDPEPEEPVEPPPPIDYTGDHPFYAIAAEMQPGEFRPVPVTLPAGVSDMAKMNSTHWLGPDIDPETGKSIGGTFGVGWTDRHIFDEETGRIFNVLIREQYQRSITWLNPDLSMGGVLAPKEAGLSRRRPFNRLCQGPDGYIYFAPSTPGGEIGRLTRFHPSTPHIWEDAGAPRIDTTSLAGSQSSGDYSLCWFPELGKFVMYTAGSGRGDTSPEGVHDYVAGRVWTWGFGDAAWVLVGRTQSCGYAGTLVYNRVHKEVLIWGGSTAYGNPHPLGGRCLAVLSAEGVLTRHGPHGLFYSAGNRRAGVHPTTGDYIMLESNTTDYERTMYIGDPTRGRPWRVMHHHKRGEVFDNYENWARVCELPRTDVLIWSDHRRGYILHKPLRWEDCDPATEIPPDYTGLDSPPVVEPEEPDEDEDVGDTPVEPEEEPEVPGSGLPQPSADGIIWMPDSVLPPMQEGERFPSLAGTRLAELIQSCPKGGYVVMDDVRLPEAFGGWSAFLRHNQLHPSLSVGRDNQTWGSQAYFDRRRLMTLQVSDRKVQPASSPQRMVFTSYVAREHLYTHLPLTYAMPGKPHPYAQQALDDVRGYYYYMPLQSVIYQYVIDESRWNVIELRPGTSNHPWQAGCSWNEALDMLVTGDGNKPKKIARLRGWRPGMDGWEDLGDLGHDCYHAHFRYGRVLGLTLVLGGNHNPRKVTIIDQHGQVHHMADRPSEISGIPFSSGMANTNISEDPLTGNFLLADQEQRVLWEYNPRLDKWAVGLDARSGQPKASVWPGPYYGNVLIPISGTDAILWSSGYQPRIYRHQAVLT